MRAHLLRLLAEVAKFLTVGGVATVVAVTLFNLFTYGLGADSLAVLNEQPIVAYVIANTVGMAISYTGSRRWTFKARPPVHRDGGRSAYVGINVATMALPVVCLWISRHVLGLEGPISDNIAANVIGLGLGTASRFYLFRRFVFRRPVPSVPLTPHEEEELSRDGARRPSRTRPPT